MHKIVVGKGKTWKLHPTPEARAFFTFAISEQNFTFAKSSLTSGAGELGRYSQEKFNCFLTSRKQMNTISSKANDKGL